ncbi:hypothetical protein DP923_06310 [Pontibacter arcticus]|uniref:Uncharacterized protein n=1 Tax=Pontibacter arcticus TaxID=2080288 RepID=A0A364RF04_9BACT|nr:hypothetical protein DP923_06310 [Pontibacter arcticus]
MNIRFKAVTYENENGKRKPKIFTDFHSGCLGFMLFPLTLLLNIALKFGVAGKKKAFVIDSKPVLPAVRMLLHQKYVAPPSMNLKVDW